MAPPKCTKREEVSGENSRNRGNGDRKARGEFRNSEDPKRNRHEPDQQRRLFNVGDVVEMRHDRVAALQHLARDLRIARLVGLPQSERSKMKEKYRRRERNDRANIVSNRCSRRIPPGIHINGGRSNITTPNTRRQYKIL